MELHNDRSHSSKYKDRGDGNRFVGVQLVEENEALEHRGAAEIGESDPSRQLRVRNAPKGQESSLVERAGMSDIISITFLSRMELYVGVRERKSTRSTR